MVDFVGKVMQTKTTVIHSAVQWNQVYSIVTPNSVVSAIGGLGPTASSVQSLAANTDGWLEFTTPEVVSAKQIGLNAGAAGAGYGAINYSFLLSQYTYWVQENGINKYNYIFSARDVFRIERISGVVRYYKNGVLLYTLQRP